MARAVLFRRAMRGRPPEFLCRAYCLIIIMQSTELRYNCDFLTFLALSSGKAWQAPAEVFVEDR